MRKFLLYLAALLTFCPVLAQAETIAATSVTIQGFKANQWPNNYGASKQAVADAWCAADPGRGAFVQWYPEPMTDVGQNFFCQNTNFVTAFEFSYSETACPAGQNWTLSGSNCTRPDCVSPQTRNVSTGVCESPACISTSTYEANGWHNVGVNTLSADYFSCISGCRAIFSYDTGMSAIIDGVRNYFYYGHYTFTGKGAPDVCTPGAMPEPTPTVTEVPVSHCASNQIEGLIDGKLNCWNVPATPGEAPTLANPDAAATTTGTSTTTISTVGDTTTTTTTTNNIGGGTTIVTEACTAGNCTTTTAESGRDKTQTTAGAGAATTGLYTADTGGKTFSGVLTSFKNTVSASPIASAAGGFFQAGTFSGNCAALDVSFTMLGHAFALDATDVFCGTTALTWYGYIAAGLLLIATALAFWIAIL